MEKETWLSMNLNTNLILFQRTFSWNHYKHIFCQEHTNTLALQFTQPPQLLFMHLRTHSHQHSSSILFSSIFLKNGSFCCECLFVLKLFFSCSMQHKTWFEGWCLAFILIRSTKEFFYRITKKKEYEQNNKPKDLNKSEVHPAQLA